MSAPEIRPPLSEQMKVFVEDYQWLKSFGMSDEGIAHRLRLTRDALDRRLFRTGIKGHIIGSDAELHARLMELIESGAEFSAADFSFTFPLDEVRNMLAVAARTKLVVKVGERPNPLKTRSSLTVFCAAPKPVAEPEPFDDNEPVNWPFDPSRDKTWAEPWEVTDLDSLDLDRDSTRRSAA